jgi:hypothetical protein
MQPFVGVVFRYLRNTKALVICGQCVTWLKLPELYPFQSCSAHGTRQCYKMHNFLISARLKGNRLIRINFASYNACMFKK